MSGVMHRGTSGRPLLGRSLLDDPFYTQAFVVSQRRVPAWCGVSLSLGIVGGHGRNERKGNTGAGFAVIHGGTLRLRRIVRAMRPALGVG